MYGPCLTKWPASRRDVYQGTDYGSFCSTGFYARIRNFKTFRTGIALFFAFVLILQFSFHLLNFEFQVEDLRWPDIFQQLKFLNFPYIWNFSWEKSWSWQWRQSITRERDKKGTYQLSREKKSQGTNMQVVIVSRYSHCPVIWASSLDKARAQDQGNEVNSFVLR